MNHDTHSGTGPMQSPTAGGGAPADAATAASDQPALLRMSDDWSLPLSTVTGTHAIVGIRGGGKTSTAVVLVEELIRARQRSVIIDPTGVWWGLTRRPDGTPSGLPVAVLGGQHGSRELCLGDAAADARHVEGLSGTTVVIDVSQLRVQAIKGYVGAFLEELFHCHAQAPIHIVLDEADLFAPQKATRADQAVLGSVEDIFRRGRTRGFGGTLIGHRPAEINKDVLSQTSTLIAMRLTLEQDRSAIAGWTSHEPDPDRRARLLDRLPTLAPGTALVSDPSREYLANVTIRPRTTLDSSPTPPPAAGGDRPVADTGSTAVAEAMAAPAPTRPDSPMPRAATRILAILAAAPSTGIPRKALADQLGLSPTGGTLAAYLREVDDMIEVNGHHLRLRTATRSP